MDFGFPGNVGDKNIQTSKHLNYVSVFKNKSKTIHS